MSDSEEGTFESVDETAKEQQKKASTMSTKETLPVTGSAANVTVSAAKATDSAAKATARAAKPKESPVKDTIKTSGSSLKSTSHSGSAKVTDSSPAVLGLDTTSTMTSPREKTPTQTERTDREQTPTRKAQRVYDEKKELDKGQDTDLNVTEVLDKVADDDQAGGPGWGWGGLGSWGTSVLSTASASVTTFTSQVGEGLQTVMDSVESSLGAIEPEEWEKMQRAEAARLAQEEALEAERKKTAGDSGDAIVKDQPHHSEQVIGEAQGGNTEGAEGGQDWFSSWGLDGLNVVAKQTVNVVRQTSNAVKKSVKETSSVVTQTVKDTSSAVTEKSKTLMTGGLGVLESIGKKTFDVLAEGDHGLKKTIKKTKEKPNLSQLLREAKEEADVRSKEEAEFVEARKSHFGAQFDDFQGLVQLEALEMLSNQCEGRVQGLLTSLKGAKLGEVKPELIAVKNAFDLEDMDSDEEEEKDHDFDRLLANHVGQLGLNTGPERLIQAQEKTRKWLMDCDTESDHGNRKDLKEIHEAAIQALAEFTACSVGVFHKVGQLLLTDKQSQVASFRTKATSLASTTRVLCSEVSIMSVKFTRSLNTAADGSPEPDAVNPLITNVYLEATNSSTYIQDAFQLLLPVLQQSVIEAHQRSLV